MYGKLFEQMYDGTLATKGPWQALVTFQQLIILANKHGEVDMTPEAIARRTTIPLEVISEGLSTLTLPDPQSRSPALEGRRIVPLDENRGWGWMIVNYGHYRKIRSQEERREYMRNYQRKRRAVNRDVNKSTENKQNQPIAVSSRQYAVKNKPSAPSALDVRFNTFWNIYPRKVGKGAAERSWNKMAPDEQLAASIEKSIEAQLNCEQWTKDGGKFIPHPSTWLNRKGWLDEVAPKVDYGRCHYCPNPATAIKNDISHCARHVDFARQGAR